MASFFLLGGAIFLDMLPWSVRALLIVGALAPLFGVQVRGRVQRDVGTAYPYPPPRSTFGRRHDDPYEDSW